MIRSPAACASWLPALAWAALLLAFSPVFADLFTEPVQVVGERVPLLAAGAALLGSAIAGRPASRFPLAGAFLLAAGLCLELVGIAAGAWSLARLGLPLACLGLAGILGRPAPQALVPLLAAVPIPTSVLVVVGPPVQRAVATLAAQVWGGPATGLSVHATGLVAPDGLLELSPTDLGLRSAVVLAAVGWTRGLCLGGFGRRVLVWAGGGLGWHLAVALIGGGLAASGHLPEARWMVRWLAPLGVFAAGLAGLGLLLREPARPRAPREGLPGAA